MTTDFSFNAPASRRRVTNKVPTAGTYGATIKDVVPQDYGYDVSWTFRADGRAWNRTEEMESKEFGDLLVDLGLAGQTVNRAMLIGKKARVVVRTYGGKKSWKIKEVLPNAA